MTEKLDLSNKDNWNMNNSQQIARELGCVPDSDFLNNLQLFIDNVVQPATITSFLKVMATGYFKKNEKEKAS